MIIECLGARPITSVTQGEKQMLISQHQSPPKMAPGGRFVRHDKQLLEICQCRICQLAAPDFGAKSSIRPRPCEGEVHPLGALNGLQADIKESALTFSGNGRETLDLSALTGIQVDAKEAPRSLGDQYLGR